MNGKNVLKNYDNLYNNNEINRLYFSQKLFHFSKGNLFHLRKNHFGTDLRAGHGMCLFPSRYLPWG